MRECWINVYPGIADGKPCAVLGDFAIDQWDADANVVGYEDATSLPDDMLAKALSKAGVGYRLHVRLKVPALPATDALAAVKAGEDENGRAA